MQTTASLTILMRTRSGYKLHIIDSRTTLDTEYISIGGVKQKTVAFLSAVKEMDRKMQRSLGPLEVFIDAAYPCSSRIAPDPPS